MLNGRKQKTLKSLSDEINETHTHKLKNEDLIIFKTNMPGDEVKSLPIFPNQHKI